MTITFWLRAITTTLRGAPEADALNLLSSAVLAATVNGTHHAATGVHRASAEGYFITIISRPRSPSDSLVYGTGFERCAQSVYCGSECEEKAETRKARDDALDSHA